ncbi:sugar kinase [Phyllobacterium sp. 628]|nr:sugar kinase [Phyllobacterium sp. 628]
MALDVTSSALALEGLGPTITVGEILVEIMATTIGKGFLEAQPLIGPFPSGAPAIFIDQVAKLGAKAGIIASVGNDDFGQLNVERLRADGADVSAIAVSQEYPTGSAFVRYAADGSRDFVYNIARSAAGKIKLTEAAKALIGRAGHLHVMGSALSIPAVWPIIEYALHTVKQRRGTVSLDPNMRKELAAGEETGRQFAALIAAADLLLPSGEELFVARPAASESEAVGKLLASGVAEIVVKRGQHGSALYTKNGHIERPAFTVEEVDPTGAGDCFGATYLTCRRLGHSAEKALDYANAAGARNVTRLGPMEGTSTFEELDQFIAATKRK